jgi:hypothetical protein
MELSMILRDEGPDFTVCDLYIDGAWECVTLQDGHRDVKERGKTRIPEGRYKIGLRTVGSKHAAYLRKFGPVIHRGMLEVKDVPGFKYILFHIGNTVADTEGCILVGVKRSASRPDFIEGSTIAYRRLYRKVLWHAQRQLLTLTIDYHP